MELKDENKQGILVPVMVGAISSKFEKIAMSAAHILRCVMKYVDDSTKEEIAKEIAEVVVKTIFVRQGHDNKSEIYETCLGLAARILYPLDLDMY